MGRESRCARVAFLDSERRVFPGGMFLSWHHAELVHGEPALADRLVEPADDGVTFGVRRAYVRTGTILFAHKCEGSARGARRSRIAEPGSVFTFNHEERAADYAGQP